MHNDDRPSAFPPADPAKKPASLKPPSSGTIDKFSLCAAIEDIHEGGSRFQQTPYAERAMLLRQIMPRIEHAAEEWVRLSCLAKGIDPKSDVAAEELLAGPVAVMRYVRLLAESMDVLAEGGNRYPFARLPVSERFGHKALQVRVFPATKAEALILPGVTAECHLTPGTLPAFGYYQPVLSEDRYAVPLGLVLGAGNVSSIPVLDALTMLFMDGKPCILKLNPVNDYLAELFESVLEPLIAMDFLRIVKGGMETGDYLCRHHLIEAVHLTGSNPTHDAIVWGAPGPERDARRRSWQAAHHASHGAEKETRHTALGKPVTSELGNVSPVIIVPGVYTPKELAWTARAVVSMVVNNASFNCNAAKVIVTSKQWPQREEFLALVRGLFKDVPPRKAYYPGAEERYFRFLRSFRKEKHLVAFGSKWKKGDETLPWCLIAGISPDRAREPLFEQESFCPILVEVAIDTPHVTREANTDITTISEVTADPFDLMLAAADFCNDRLAGTLNACIMVSADTGRDHAAQEALGRLIDELRYGTVAVNQWPALGYALGSTPWGAAPGGTLLHPGSGIGWVHNAFMLANVEKVVIRSKLAHGPKPLWFTGNRAALRTAKRLLRYEADPTWVNLIRLGLASLGA
ncbi:MAG: hypothetical protein RLZZ324_318 [Candidatus Parcubacteria bacterium]|jgi:aldehyde dehydrogenase (NAD(P)+)